MKMNSYYPLSSIVTPRAKQPYQAITSQSTSIFTHKADQVSFAGKKMQDDRNRQSKLQLEINNYQKRIEGASSEIRQQTIVGGITGAGGTAMTLGLDLGLTTLLGTALGNIRGRVQALSQYGSSSQNSSRRDSAQATCDTLNSNLAAGETHLRNISDIERHAQTALIADARFYDCDFHSLAHGLFEPYYDDVADRATEVRPKVGRVPGFIERFNAVTKRTLDADPIEDLKHDLNTGSEALQDLTLQRIAQVDTKREDSPGILRKYLENKNPKLAARALRVLVEHPELREGDNKVAFIRGMERFLESGQPEKMNAALDAIEKTAYPSANINQQLRIQSEHWPMDLRHRAIIAKDFRVAQGTDRPFNSHQSSEKILKGMVGNDFLKKDLQKITRSYVGSINDKSNKGPALAIYLPGKPGIGKTRLVSRVQQEFHHDPNGLIIIKLGQLKSKDQLVKLLKDASPLLGKTLFFDEFQEFNHSNTPLHEKYGIIEFMKLLFDTEIPADNDTPPELKKHYGIDPKNVILAIGTNVDLSRMGILKSEIGAPLRDRITSMCREVDLEDDLRAYIPDFVNGFAENRFFDGATTGRSFENIKEITPHAKEQLIKTMKSKASSEEEVSGRFLTNKMVTEINDAVQDQLERGTQFASRDGIVTQPLKIDVDHNGDLFAV
jgi:hypothetical protein